MCGEGLGHASRSRIVIKHLLQKNHQVSIIAGGKAYSYLSNIFQNVAKIEWPGVIYSDNAINIFHTMIHISYRTLVGSIPSFFKLRKRIKKEKPDVLVTDAEPISYYAARLSKIPCVSIDNPQAMLYRKYSVSLSEIIPYIIFSVTIKLSLFGADKYLIYDFSNKQIAKENIIFLKPLIQQGILNQTPSYGNHVFVYQTSKTNNNLLTILRKINEQFIIYGFNKNYLEGNLQFKKFNENEFYEDISQSKAIISNGGFTVLSEALYLKKPIFSIPLRNQFEQVINGKFISQLGAGVSYDCVTEARLKNFLSKLSIFQKNLKKYDSGNQLETLEVISRELENI